MKEKTTKTQTVSGHKVFLMLLESLKADFEVKRDAAHSSGNTILGTGKVVLWRDAPDYWVRIRIESDELAGHKSHSWYLELSDTKEGIDSDEVGWPTVLQICFTRYKVENKYEAQIAWPDNLDGLNFRSCFAIAEILRGWGNTVKDFGLDELPSATSE